MMQGMEQRVLTWWRFAILIGGALPMALQGAPGDCADISGRLFTDIELRDGLGSFGDDALSESWEVACPAGVSPCPLPVGSSYTPVLSGPYSVTYHKTTTTGSDQCDYTLHVGARGLQTDLRWEWYLGTATVDLDLHLHKPGDTQPWGGARGNAVDCAWDNCTVNNYSFGTGVDWFNGVVPPDPVDWYLDPIFEENVCYFAPRGVGQEWQSIGMGCHNPRLDLDNITCDPAQTDPNQSDYCHAETNNIDFPPRDQWIRLGAHYYYNSGQSYDVHPKLRVFCDAALVSTLGDATDDTTGFGQEVTFHPADGTSASTNLFWLAADVLFPSDPPVDGPSCIVRPIYADIQRSPYLTTADIVTSSFGPPYPAVPDAAGQALFADDFESGDTSAWSGAFP